MSRHMRTTVRLEDALLRRAKREAGEVSLTDLMPLHSDGERRWAYYVPQPIPDDAVKHANESVRDLKIHRLSREQAESFTREWTRIQGMFVDDPDGAVAAAERLVTQVMSARGYPIEDFDTRAADLSVEHPRVVENYRVARALGVRRSRGEAGTEELRQAVVNYRALFDDLLKTDEGAIRRAS